MKICKYINVEHTCSYDMVTLLLSQQSAMCNFYEHDKLHKIDDHGQLGEQGLVAKTRLP